ncbi:T9SS type A sorting domain-containing protein [candidate division KSB1 bacterium]|nr:T9SS type A sorting domain-containing protein [candidate division KSB1 bacterium]
MKYEASRATRIAAFLCFCISAFLPLSSVAREYGVNGTVAFEFPPAKSDPQLRVDVRGDERSLDDPWSLVQELWDADTSRPELWNAYPVGMAMSHEGRGYIAMLHTVFGTLDGGHTWYNMDPFPPPFVGGPFTALRAPTYISALAARPVKRTIETADSFFVTTLRADADSGTVRAFRWTTGTWRPAPAAATIQPMWLSQIAFSDSLVVNVLADQFGRIVRNDSLGRDSTWDLLPFNFFGGYLAGTAAAVGNLVIASGSQQWISRSRGQVWHVEPAVDSLGDVGVSFSDSLHGFSGGGIVSPAPAGWVHRTDDGAVNWSERLLEAPFPIRAVVRYSDSVGWAAGGYIDGDAAIGGIYKTTDAGLTWSQELTVNAEIRALTATHITPAYVDVFAAGAYPDFHAGVWSTRLYWPDSSLGGPILFADPDTLAFGIVEAGARDTLRSVLRNIGQTAVTLFALDTRGGRFSQVNSLVGTVLQPGDSVELLVQFAPEEPGLYRTAIDQLNNVGQRCEIICSGLAPTAATGGNPVIIRELALDVWPNPGNAEFTLKFALPRAGDVTLNIFDVTGRLVDTQSLDALPAGSHTRVWNAANFASGIYFARIESGTELATKKIMLLK